MFKLALVFVLIAALATAFVAASEGTETGDDPCPDDDDIPARIMCWAHHDHIINKDGFPAVDRAAAQQFLLREIPLNERIRACVADEWLDRHQLLGTALDMCVQKLRPITVDVPHNPVH